MNHKLLKSTIILLVGGFLTKLLGMAIKMTLARHLPTQTIGLYMMILPTFMLLINLSQFGFPLAITKLVAEGKNQRKEIFFSILPCLITINIILIALTILLSPLISTKLLHHSSLSTSIVAMALVIPFTSISSICRSYFFGKEEIFPHVLSTIVEDIVRLLLYGLGIPYILKYKAKTIICFLILSNIISESISTMILLFFLPKKISIQKKDLFPKKRIIKDCLKISIPNTSSRFLGSIAYFLEPILLTSILLKMGYPQKYILKEYGILSGYAIPLILLPSFFTLSISQVLLPSLTKDFSSNNKQKAKQKTKIAIHLSMGIGTIFMIIFIKYAPLLLKIIYHTKKGSFYVKILSPICILQGIEYPLSSCLEAMGKSKENLKTNILSTVFRTVLLIITSYCKIGLNSLIISIIMTNLFTTFYQIKIVNKNFSI